MDSWASLASMISLIGRSQVSERPCPKKPNKGLAKWLRSKGVALKPHDLCSIPGTHMLEREKWIPQVVPDLHTCTMASMHPPTNLLQITVRKNKVDST